MKQLKKIIVLTIIMTLCLSLTGCKAKRVEGSLEEIMSKIYGDISKEELPMGLENIELNEENQEYYLGTNDITYKEAIASESMTGSIAHSIVLIRLNEGDNSEEIIDILKDTVNPRKWICVGVEEVKIENIGDLIVVIMNDTHKDILVENFNNLSK